MSARGAGSLAQEITSVRTTMAFAAPVTRVWNGLLFYEQIDERPPLYLRVLLPVPLGTQKTEAVVGARVRCSYEGGHLVKRITELDPRRCYRFDVVEQTLVIGGGMTLSGGSYSLRERPDGRTEVAVTTRYARGRRPAWFWQPVEAAVCHLFHRHLLAAVRRKVETDGLHDGP
jgi:hypothetical protein